jgi:SIR2-like domain
LAKGVQVNRFPDAALERLARRIAAGEVVFFIGAGFSLDSEGNSAPSLIRRLLARLLAMADVLERTDLIQGLCETFGLKGPDKSTGDPASLATDENVQRLSNDYYSINDWCTNAFSELLADLKKDSAWRRQARRIHTLEEKLRQRLEEGAEGYERTGISLPRLAKKDLEKLFLLDGDGGKALFLDTMGFADDRIFSGQPSARERDLVAGSFGNRLRQRHFVLAWLAREGLCPTLVTTNYDMLIEGAYRLAGASPRELRTPSSDDPTATYALFSRIAAAEDFFLQGAAHRSALIVKIHGCAERYRKERMSSTERWRAYLPAMVFTYREIQNWRQDAWSCDFLRTVLRTHTLAFAGYSAVDPVLHDTFRTVYEEMAQRRRSAAAMTSGQRQAEEAPAFCFGIAGRREFHAVEILRAASAAAGCEQRPLRKPPNLLPFYLSGDAEKRFPNLDEAMLWTFHLVFRQRQREALVASLRQAVLLLFGRPAAEADLGRILHGFDQLCSCERKAAARWTDHAAHRAELARIVGWSTGFHASLLQEWALAAKVLRYQGPGLNLDRLRRSPWYQPASEQPAWTAWGAVLEIALRRAIARWRGKPRAWVQDTPWVRPGKATGGPQIFFGRSSQAPTPMALTIRLTAFDRLRSAATQQVGLREHVTWHLQPSDLPWRRDGPRGEDRRDLPPAHVIWRCATGGGTALDVFLDG